MAPIIKASPLAVFLFLQHFRFWFINVITCNYRNLHHHFPFCQNFKHGTRTSGKEDSSTTPEMVPKIHDVVLADRELKVTMLVKTGGI